MKKEEYYIIRENKFTCYVHNTPAIIRENSINEVLDHSILIEYLSSVSHENYKYTSDIRFAKFSKIPLPLVIRDHITNTLSLTQFLELNICDVNSDDYVLLRNKKLVEKEKHLLKRRKKSLSEYLCTTPYIPVKLKEYNLWDDCVKCGLKPLIWEFNNGSVTACGCGKDNYDHFSIASESILSYIKRHDGSALDYPSDGLRKNWNHYQRYGEILFDRKNSDNRW